jgi:hypothetical protein
MPREIVDRLARELSRALAQPEVRAQLESVAFQPQGSSADELAAMLKEQIEIWSKAGKEAGSPRSESSISCARTGRRFRPAEELRGQLPRRRRVHQHVHPCRHEGRAEFQVPPRQLRIRGQDPRALPFATMRRIAPSIACCTSGCPGLPRCPSEADRSAGPMNTPSMPSTAQMASRFCSAVTGLRLHQQAHLVVGDIEVVGRALQRDARPHRAAHAADPPGR